MTEKSKLQGFFHKVEKKPIKKKAKSIIKKNYSCETCNLKGNKRFEVQGKGRKKILIIGNKLNKRKSIYHKKEIAYYLQDQFNKHDLFIDRDCFVLPAIQCYSDSKTETDTINSCRQELIKIIKEIKPQKIILLGKTPFQVLLGGKLSLSNYERHFNYAIPDQDLESFLFVLPDVNSLFWDEEKEAIKKLNFKFFEKYIEKAILHNEQFEKLSPEIIDGNIEILTDKNRIYDLLKFIKKEKKEIFIDIETSGLKPQAKGHFIKSISFSFESNSFDKFEKQSYSFLIFQEDKEFCSLLKDVLEDESIKKIAHNVSFENNWLKVILGIEIKGWLWDTMLAAHVLDNAPKTKSLKFQTYVNFGITGYEKEVEKYLKSNDKSANAFNKINEAPLDKLLKYNTYDTLFTFWLYKLQKEKMNKRDLRANEFFTEGIVALSEVEQNGVNIDYDYFLEQEKELEEKIIKLEKDILESKEVKKWPKENFNYKSTKDLPELLFDVLKYKSVKKTAKGADSVDAEALENIKSPLVKKILEIKKSNKTKDTYLAGFIRESANSRIHPNFYLSTVQTYRGSSGNPNFQNIPVRDEIVNKIIRSGIIPEKNCNILELDYKAIEVAISACYHKDPAMIKYIKDLSTDMHRDTAMDLFLIEDENEISEKMMKLMRYNAKNKFVFPQFYGDWYVSCAKNLWENCDREMISFLKDKGIKKYNDFENHVKEVESIFWEDRFPIYNKWKKDTWNFYLKKGFLKSHTGFTYKEKMKRNEALNRAIQGTAFHCLLWSVIKINEFLKKEKLKSKIIGQIHDAILFNEVKEEAEFLRPAVKKIMTEDIRKEWEWLIVPLTVEAEFSDISWYHKKEIQI